ncbi:MAG: hypothetical protein NTY47_04520, partial [Candidatus Omnitrophica bacterium]|nr:hypothetical protein [Candidatus Omnitrophota bacterium]
WCIVSVLIAVSGITAYLFSSIAGYNCFLMTSHDFLGNVNKELVWRLVSVFRHPGMLTLYLHASIVFGLILVAKNKGGRRYYLGYVIVALCFIAALLTKTRCNAGIAITIFLIVASLDIKNIYFSILRYISFIYALAFMAIAIVLTVWWVFPVHLQIDQKRQVVSLELNVVKQPYFIHHMAELKIIRDFPLVGVGLGMYNQRQASYIRWGDLEKPYHQIFPDLKKENESAYRRTDPHSLYFGMGAESGLLGLGAMLIFFLLLARLFYRKIKEGADNQNRYIYVVFLAGLAGFLFNGLYLDMLTVRSFWLMFAMGAAYKD